MSEEKNYHVVMDIGELPYVASPLGEPLVYLESERLAGYMAETLNRETGVFTTTITSQAEEIARLKRELEHCEIVINDAIEASAPDIPPYSAEEKVEAMVKALGGRHEVES